MLKGILAATIAAAIWGGMYVVSKLVLEVVPPLTLVVVRFCVALPVLFVWQKVMETRGAARFTLGDFLSLAAPGFVGFCVSLGAQFAGTHLSTASLGAVITSATPAFVVPCAYVLLREKPTLWKLIGLALASIGVVLVINPGADAIGQTPNMLMGNALLILAALTWALYSVMVKRATARGMSALAATLGVTLWGVVFDAPLAALELRNASIGAITPAVLAGILYLGVVSTAIAFYLWNKGFELLDANTAALCFFAQPVTGALLGVLILSETPGPGFIIGGALIALGALVSQIQMQNKTAHF